MAGVTERHVMMNMCGEISRLPGDNQLQWRHNGHDCVSNHQPHDCLLNRLFGRKSTKTSKLRVTGLCAGNSPETGEFPTQMASNAENFSIWWRHHAHNGGHRLFGKKCHSYSIMVLWQLNSGLGCYYTNSYKPWCLTHCYVLQNNLFSDSVSRIMIIVHRRDCK